MSLNCRTPDKCQNRMPDSHCGHAGPEHQRNALLPLPARKDVNKNQTEDICVCAPGAAYPEQNVGDAPNHSRKFLRKLWARFNIRHTQYGQSDFEGWAPMSIFQEMKVQLYELVLGSFGMLTRARVLINC